MTSERTPCEPQPVSDPASLRSTAKRFAETNGSLMAPTCETPIGPIEHSSVRRGTVRGHVVVAVRMLRNRLAEPWTLDALANEVHPSRSQLVRAFDTTPGMSPMAYLRQMRVERMARLLVSTGLSIAEAARSVG